MIFIINPLALYGLFVHEKNCFEEIKLFRHDPFFKKTFGLANSGHYFLIKRNLRKESPDYRLDKAIAEGEIIHNNGKITVFRGVHTDQVPAGDKTIPVMDLIFKVTKRYVDKKRNPDRGTY